MGWSKLTEIQRLNRQERADQRQQPPLACPIDGVLLEIKGGIRNCPMGNFTYTGGPAPEPN